MRVLGIDPGLRVAGYAVVELLPGVRDPKLVEAGVIRLHAQDCVATRLAQLYTELQALISETSPDRLAVEEIFSHVKHVKTAVIMGHGRGVVLLAAAERSLPIDELAPTEVKKALTGRGHASKAQVQRAVMHQFGLATLPDPPDVADAIGIAATAARRLTALAAVALQPHA